MTPSEIAPLYEAWHTSRIRLEQSSPSNLAEFTDRLVRRLSVETGILERLYDLNRGTTEALVASGFAENLVSHQDTDIEPSRLIDILRDHEAAIQTVMDTVTRRRELTPFFMNEIHAILTRHQTVVEAVDQFGNRTQIPLEHGKFKQMPNNPTRPDGTIHEYCPPIQVASEVDRLIELLADYDNEDPILVAAWLHHRFAQIHPYQDGNGRVARALTTLLLVRANLLPLVVDRDTRGDYIQALEAADAGDLQELVDLFARLERSAILQALSVDADKEIEHQTTLTGAAIASLADRFKKTQADRFGEFSQVNSVAEQLRNWTARSMSASLEELREAIAPMVNADTTVIEGGPDHRNGHWYKFEVVKTANEANTFVNFNEPHYFVRGRVQPSSERLTFVVSFHHVGRILSGIMEATAFGQLESFESPAETVSASKEFTPCSVEPFVFSYRTEIGQVSESFANWLDRCLATAVAEFSSRL